MDIDNYIIMAAPLLLFVVSSKQAWMYAAAAIPHHIE
jgi:hypothetical protein